MNTAELQRFCTEVRRDIINMTANAGSGHPGGSLSAVELMSAIFCTQMRIDPKNPKDPDRDRFVLSKGHAAPCYYGVLAELGFFDKAEFQNFRQLHSILQGHPDMKKVPGVDASTGSLGQGVSIAVGMALGAKHLGKDTKIFTILGDGECQDLAAKLWAFGFHTIELSDGNDLEQVLAALNEATEPGKPKAILAHTVKGKGVSFMENQAGWHGKAPNEEERQQALKELEG